MPPVETFHFGSVAGATFALVFFAGIYSLSGFATYMLLTRYHLRREPFRRLGVASRRVGLLCGGGLALIVFLSTYFATLHGFYRLDVAGDEIRLGYILPSRSRTLRREEVFAVEQRPGYRFRWRLILHIEAGETFQSAQSNRGDVQESEERMSGLIHESP